MIEHVALITILIYLLIGLSWANILSIYVFKDMKSSHKLVSVVFWPFDIIIGSILS